MASNNRLLEAISGLVKSIATAPAKVIGGGAEMLGAGAGKLRTTLNDPDFQNSLQEFSENLQGVGTGISRATGHITDKQMDDSLENLKKLKEGRLEKENQRVLGERLEAMMQQEGVQQEFTQDSTGKVTRTVKPKDFSKQTSKSALAYAASQDPVLANNPVIQAYLGIAPPAPQESSLSQQEKQRQNRLSAFKIPQTPYKLETEMKTVKGVAVPQQKKTMLSISDRNAIMKAAAAEAQSSKTEDIKTSYNRIIKELGYIIPCEDISGTKQGRPSFDTEAEAVASGIRGEVFISGKLARIGD